MDSSFLERLSQLETRFDKFSMVGTDDVIVAGNLKSGFTVNIGIQGSGIKGGGVGVGACCYNDGTCDVLTEIDCTNAGGNYQGDGSNCSTEGICLGACCEGEGNHTCVPNSTPDSCEADGGIFQDFGSTCDPNPCPPLPPCNGCGFDAFDGSGRKFLTATYSQIAGPCTGCGDGCDDSVNFNSIQTYDTLDCSTTSICSGSYVSGLGGDIEWQNPPCNTFISAYGCCGEELNPDFCGECCQFPGCMLIGTSATHAECSYHYPNDPPYHVTGIITVDLSDECIP